MTMVTRIPVFPAEFGRKVKISFILTAHIIRKGSKKVQGNYLYPVIMKSFRVKDKLGVTPLR